METKDYLDRTLIKLRRKYHKDEIISALDSKLKEQELKIGALESEIEHLTFLLNKKNEMFEFDKEVRQTKLYTNLLEKNHQRCKDIKRLKDNISYVISSCQSGKLNETKLI